MGNDEGWAGLHFPCALYDHHEIESTGPLHKSRSGSLCDYTLICLISESAQLKTRKSTSEQTYKGVCSLQYSFGFSPSDVLHNQVKSILFVWTEVVQEDILPDHGLEEEKSFRTWWHLVAHAKFHNFEISVLSLKSSNL